MTRYNEVMRKDPARRAEVTRRLDEERALYREVVKAADALEAALRALPRQPLDALLADSKDQYLLGLIAGGRHQTHILQGHNETYVGNLAAQGKPFDWTGYEEQKPSTGSDQRNSLDPGLLSGPFSNGVSQ